MSESKTSYDNGGQYSRHSILRYEKIFGDGFVSTGGLPIVEHFCQGLALPKGAKVLDIGCGLGGAAFYMADKYDAEILGLDLAGEMVEIANERAAARSQDKVSFRLEDALAIDLPEGHFDLIWSRDALLHIADKPALFARCYQWLKPGGQVMISDYACSEGQHSEAFATYVKDSGYHLLDVESYGGLLTTAGLTTKSEDWTSLFVDTLIKEMEDLQARREHFLSDFGEADLDYLLARWQRKIGYCNEGNMRVGFWHAKKD